MISMVLCILYTQEGKDASLTTANKPETDSPSDRNQLSASARPSSSGARPRPGPLALSPRSLETSTLSEWSPLKYIESTSARGSGQDKQLLVQKQLERTERGTGHGNQLAWKQLTSPPQKTERGSGQDKQLLLKQLNSPPQRTERCSAQMLQLSLKLESPPQRPGRGSGQVSHLTRQLSRKFSAKINNSFDTIEDSAFSFPFRNKTVSCQLMSLHNVVISPFRFSGLHFPLLCTSYHNPVCCAAVRYTHLSIEFMFLIFYIHAFLGGNSILII